MILRSTSLAIALGLAACAAPTSEEVADAEEAVRGASIAPGTFRLHTQPNHTEDLACDNYTSLELTPNGRAKLVSMLTGRCALTAFYAPFIRDYSLRQTGTNCGSKIYEGTTRVDGPVARGRAKIKITDHRSRVCRDLVPAKIIVEEAATGLPRQTLFSQSEVTRDPCANFACPTGQVCTAPADAPYCIPAVTRDPCANFACPAGQVCTAPADAPYCID
jgi:hypothetical protein